MEIFVISRGCPSKIDPQWGNFEMDQARALAAQGHHVVMLSIDIRHSKVKNNLGITKIMVQDVVSYSLNPGPWVIVKLLSRKLYFWLFRRFMLSLFERVINQESKPDVLYTHYQNNSLAALSIKNKYKIPIVGLEHWSALCLDNPPKIAIEHGRYVYPALDKVLVVSNALKRNIKKYFNIEADVLNNIIGDEFCYVEHSNEDGLVHFALTGNLIPLKGFDLAIKAFKSVLNERRDVKMTIVGDGPERDNLRKLIEENDLKDFVHMVGRKDRNYIVQLLQSSDVYIMSSSSETFGVAAGEALACGVPVISTDCGGPRDFMNDFNGILIPVNDVDAMEKAILHMVEHYKEYDRKRIAQDCHERFSSETIANQLTTIFNDVVKR